jgi:hypothetical protein
MPNSPATTTRPQPSQQQAVSVLLDSLQEIEVTDYWSRVRGSPGPDKAAPIYEKILELGPDAIPQIFEYAKSLNGVRTTTIPGHLQRLAEIAPVPTARLDIARILSDGLAQTTDSTATYFATTLLGKDLEFARIAKDNLATIAFDKERMGDWVRVSAINSLATLGAEALSAVDGLLKLVAIYQTAPIGVAAKDCISKMGTAAHPAVREAIEGRSFRDKANDVFREILAAK